MDYEKLIEQYQNAADHWRKNKPDFPDVASSYERAATALATIQAENERLKNKLSELAHLQFDEPGIGERTRLMAENESLRAEVEHWKNAHHQAALNFQQENRECNKVLAELEQVKRELQAYKDTGLEPEDFKRAFHEDAVLKLAGQALGIAPDRLRELAQADKECISPCTFCRFNPPSSGDGKPCCMCPAVAALRREQE
jgi:chaperonin cofactor prefoldin|nr:MAG TPA: SH3 domain protein [Caudoviricetes sp.]